MRRYLTYCALTPLLLLAFGCSRDWSAEGGYVSETIQFEGGEVTKAFLEADGLKKTGTRVQVYDFLTGFNGTINGSPVSPSATVKYVDDIVEYQETTLDWPFTNTEHEYRWTKSGTHRFFGWLYKDQTYNNNAGMTTDSFFGTPVLDELSLVMTTPDFCWTTASPQYDFLYSRQVVIRDAASGDYSAVVLPMKHLFTAVSLTLENLSTASSIQITGLSTLYNGEDKFLHKGYAQVDFSANGELTPTYTLTGDETRPFFSASGMTGILVAPNEQYDLMKTSNNKLKDNTGAATGNTQAYYMTWPLTQQQISNYKLNPFGEKYYDEEDKILAVSYRINGQGAEQTVRIPFPDKPWRAGTKTHMNIQFTDKAISISAETLPWDFNDHEISFNSESLVVPDKLSIDGATNLGDNATVYLTPENPELTCKLYISSLQGATLVINKVGADPSFFTLDPSSLTITGRQLSFKIKASDLSTGGILRTCRLSFTVVLPDGREIEGDSEILGTDHNYTFARQ